MAQRGGGFTKTPYGWENKTWRIYGEPCRDFMEGSTAHCRLMLPGNVPACTPGRCRSCRYVQKRASQRVHPKKVFHQPRGEYVNGAWVPIRTVRPARLDLARFLEETERERTLAQGAAAAQAEHEAWLKRQADNVALDAKIAALIAGEPEPAPMPEPMPAPEPARSAQVPVFAPAAAAVTAAVTDEGENSEDDESKYWGEE